MQTFLPYADFVKTAKCLDYRRLGKQRVEAFQILNILEGKTTKAGWKHHPAVLMWKGYENALKKYPATRLREDLMILILKAKYQQALLSYAETKVDRYQSAIDEYYNYINEFPTGKFRKEADDMLKVSEKNIK